MRIHRYGDVSVIRHDDVPLPAPSDGQVLIRVAATSFNPSEIGLRRGLLRSIFPLDLPYTLGGDVAGVVAEIGEDVSAFTVGDRVVGRLDGGAAAEYVTAEAKILVAAPTTIPLAHAAAMPIAGVTAWQAVFEHADIRPGQRVLVNGAGGVGRFAIQLAKYAGAHVIATAGPRSAEAVRRLGADRIVDYTTAPVADALDEPVDALLNFAAIDSSQVAELAPLVRPGGVLVSATLEVGQLAGPRLRAVRFVVRNDIDHLAALVKLVDAGAVSVGVEASRPLAELASVHRDAEAGRISGKTIIVPEGSPA
ncbi:NADP-dependent oxidoreductase [Streptosporangium subroseum]|uniref:NADP-dependent oxidoreductase n=1 Tax=Streptosporangium subroseum TaxID=106412 RepID=UPI00308ED961|nr:NADP-dependent oxidoreductase [Streptosporangium subroseum]